MTEGLLRLAQLERLRNREVTLRFDNGKYVVRMITLIPSTYRHAWGVPVRPITDVKYLKSLVADDCIVLFVASSKGVDVTAFEDDFEDLFNINLEELIHS